jgi:PAS domain-containing protein
MLNPPEVLRRLREVAPDLGADGFIAALMGRVIDGISVADGRSGRLLLVSDSYCTLTGYGRDELVGHTTAELGLLSGKTFRARAVRQATEGSRDLHELPVVRWFWRSAAMSQSVDAPRRRGDPPPRRV